LDRVQRGRCTPFATALLAQLATLERYAASVDACFVSPLGKHGFAGSAVATEEANATNAGGKKSKLARMAEWGEYASKRRAACASQREASHVYWVLEQVYEALRVLVNSWEEHVEIASVFLRMMLGEHQANSRSEVQVLGPRGFSLGAPEFVALRSFLTQHECIGASRFGELEEVLLRKFRKHECGSGFRGLIFVQQRVTAHVLVHFLSFESSDAKELFRCAPLYATSTPATPSLAVTKGQARARLAAFAAGEINLLVCTAVAEEGMDVPAANCVIRFDEVLNAVSHVQGRGRARQSDSSFVVLRERPDRPVAELEDANFWSNS